MQITINNWKKHNRKDVTRPTWFACSNTMVEDDDFFSFSGDEFKVWIHILSKASQKQSPTISINFEAAHRKCNIKEKVYRDTIEKLVILQMVTIDVTDTLRERNDRVPLQTNKQTNIQDNTLRVGSKILDEKIAELFAVYPKRDGENEIDRSKATIKKLMKSENDFLLAITAAKNYAAHCDLKKKTGTEFVKAFGNFFGARGNWKEWANKEPAKPKTKMISLEEVPNEKTSS